MRTAHIHVLPAHFDTRTRMLHTRSLNTESLLYLSSDSFTERQSSYYLSRPPSQCCILSLLWFCDATIIMSYPKVATYQVKNCTPDCCDRKLRMVRKCSSTTRTDRSEVVREPGPSGSGKIDRHRSLIFTLFPLLPLHSPRTSNDHATLSDELSYHTLISRNLVLSESFPSSCNAMSACYVHRTRKPTVRMFPPESEGLNQYHAGI